MKGVNVRNRASYHGRHITTTKMFPFTLHHVCQGTRHARVTEPHPFIDSKPSTSKPTTYPHNGAHEVQAIHQIQYFLLGWTGIQIILVVSMEPLVLRTITVRSCHCGTRRRVQPPIRGQACTSREVTNCFMPPLPTITISPTTVNRSPRTDHNAEAPYRP